MRALVTVGTTSFDALVEAAVEAETLRALSSLGFTELRLQTGRGEAAVEEGRREGVEVSAFRFAPSLKGELEAADLVVSHAGAGTVLEALGLGKRLLVVVNEALHDNHQTELAQRLSDDGHLHWCLPRQLAQTLRERSFDDLEPWQEGRPERFAHWLDGFVGISKAK